MAINYNLAKVYERADQDAEYVSKVISLFVNEVPNHLKHIENGIENKNYQMTLSYSNKIRPTLDLLGMTNAYQEIIEIENWSTREGKRKEIRKTFESIANQIEKAIKEIKKDFDV
jgi:hypothetical protein